MIHSSTWLRSWLAFSTLAPSGLAAQEGIELTPTVGVYLSPGTMIDQTFATCSCHFAFAQRPGVLVGGRIGFGVASRVAIEGTVDFGSSRVRTTLPNTPPTDTTGTVVIMGARLRLDVVRLGVKTRLFAAVGAAYLAHTSPGYGIFASSDDAAISLGVGVRYAAGQHLVARLDLEDYYFRAVLGGVAPIEGAQHANDILISVGVGVAP